LTLTGNPCDHAKTFSNVIMDQKIRACLLGPPGEGRQQGERGRRRKGEIVEPSR
jgi:hypothetical protein